MFEPPPPDIDALDDDLLEEVYDAGSMVRGRVYADDGRVNVLRSLPGSISGVCKGSGSASYVTRVDWNLVTTSDPNPDWHGRTSWVYIDDSCTCPMGEACKHCVALILTARRQATGEPQPATASAPGKPAQWREVLSALATETANDGNVTALALELTVSQPTSSYAANQAPRVSIRPLRRGKTGKWIKTGASWRDVGNRYATTAGFDPNQQTVLRALTNSGRIGDYYYANNERTPLDQFGPDLWLHLERAVDVGIELISDRPDEVVELSKVPARVRIDLKGQDDGAVDLTAAFAIDDEDVAIGGERGGLIGAPPHGLWVRDHDHLRLVPLAAPLDPTVGRLARSGALSVPPADVDELLDVYQPLLARHASVESSDGSITITTTRFDGIALVVERTAHDVAHLRWMARYRRGERVIDHPLGGSGGQARDRRYEAAAVTALALPIHLLPDLIGRDGAPQDLTLSGPAVVTLLTEVVPWLESTAGIEVDVRGAQPALREATTDPLISLTVADGADGADGVGGRRDSNDWFDLGVDVSVDGQTIDFATLFAALNRDDEALILPSGTWLRLDRPELAKLRELITEARGLAEPTGEGVARINRFQVSWWDELTELGVVAEQSHRWVEKVSRMAALAAPEPVPVPAGLDATLRHYQQEGLDWLAFLHGNGLGGILADDMGLGKTIQTLALFLHILDEDPDARFLVVAPTSVVDNWAREAAHFAPGLTVQTIRESGRRRPTSLAKTIDGATVVVTSYALFRIELEEYARHDWEILVLDEAQFVKNPRGKTYQSVRRLDAATKIAITGTPLENTIMDLWSLLSITAPGLFPDPKRFSEVYRKPIERGEAPELLATLRRRIAPLLRRRTKDEVLTELPPKTEQTVEVELEPRHARIYSTQLQRQRQKILGLVGDVQKNRFEILKSLTLLRQLALDPGLVDEAHANVGSAKLDRLLDDLEQIVAEGHRALVFSQFTRYLAKVRTRLDEAGIDHAYLDGRTRRRDEEIARFKDGDVPVFVISLKAGGFGLNLAEADYCFVLDPWWNPAAETQAVDRAHRIGQQNPVMVYRYVSTGTIEDKVMELKARKAALFDRVLDAEGALAGALTEDDIRGLLDLG